MVLVMRAGADEVVDAITLLMLVPMATNVLDTTVDLAGQLVTSEAHDVTVVMSVL
jgi:hypothetical protein